jgi:hypothetical protein
VTQNSPLRVTHLSYVTEETLCVAKRRTLLTNTHIKLRSLLSLDLRAQINGFRRVFMTVPSHLAGYLKMNEKLAFLC